MADYLSRAGTVGTAYIEEEESLKIDSVFLEALEEVSLRTLTPKALAEAWALCPEVKCHKAGNLPKSVKMGYQKIEDYDIYCEISDSPRPMVPIELRETIMQTFHALAHPSRKES